MTGIHHIFNGILAQELVSWKLTYGHQYPSIFKLKNIPFKFEALCPLLDLFQFK